MKAICLLIFLLGCSQLRMVDQSRINHRGMDFDNDLTPKPVSFMSNLQSFEQGSGGGGCSTCAH